jgi:hypothetical protein
LSAITKLQTKCPGRATRWQYFCASAHASTFSFFFVGYFIGEIARIENRSNDNYHCDCRNSRAPVEPFSDHAIFPTERQSALDFFLKRDVSTTWLIKRHASGHLSSDDLRLKICGNNASLFWQIIPTD